MMDIMYDIPGRTDVLKCVITKDTIKNSKPMLVVGDTKKALDAPKTKKTETAS
jgi:ATP-dependent Clp protease ATP-binding subunit ClpX